MTGTEQKQFTTTKIKCVFDDDDDDYLWPNCKITIFFFDQFKTYHIFGYCYLYLHKILIINRSE